MDRVRMGIIGVGNIAPLNVAGYLDHDRCDVVALCDPREDKAKAKAAEWGVPRVYTRLDDLLADPEVDAVEVLTPTYLHKQHVLAAVAAGKHVSCQKPLANSVADGVEMTEAARRAGVTFRVSECFFHYPPLVWFRAGMRARGPSRRQLTLPCLKVRGACSVDSAELEKQGSPPLLATSGFGRSRSVSSPPRCPDTRTR